MPKNISIIEGDVLIDGVSTSMVAQTLADAGMDKIKVGEILGWWVVGAVGGSRPPAFDFVTDVQASDPQCEITYSRTFEHVDWRDGEDRVQAGSTPEELGFNARFHAIENEFDAITDQFTRLGACVTDIRADLVGVVRELESKITAIQNDIHDLKEGKPTGVPTPGGIIGSATVAEKDVFITQIDDKFNFIEFAGSTIGRTLDAQGSLDLTRTYEPDRVGPAEMLAYVEGVEDVFELPPIRGKITQPGGASVADIRVLTEGVTLASGISMTSLLAGMHSGTRFASVPEAVEEVTGYILNTLPEETRDLVRNEVIADPAARKRTGRAVLSTGVAALGVTGRLEGALKGAGAATVGTLSRTTSAALRDRLAEGGVEVERSVVREAVAKAHIARAMRAGS